MTFLNATLLFGLIAAMVPVVVHWFARTRYDEVDWAATMFLASDERTTRKTRIDQWLLLALRMTAVAILAFALAAPSLPGWRLMSARQSDPRDVAILIDGSSSMAIGQPAPIDQAKRFAESVIARLQPGDRVSVEFIRNGPRPDVAWEGDFDRARGSLDLLPAPGGTADLPTAVAVAAARFRDPLRIRQIVVITDDQRFGKFDERSRSRWSNPDTDIPVTMAIMPAKRPADAGRFTLAPIRTNRGVAVANRDITFRTAAVSRDGAPLPATAFIEWNGRRDATILLATDGSIRFTKRLPVGSHVVSVVSGDVRVDRAIQVRPMLPILIVTGEHPPEAHPLAIALAPARDPSPSFQITKLTAGEFNPLVKLSEFSAVVFEDVARLSFDQNRMVEAYLQSGGGVLVVPGPKFDAAGWNTASLRGGLGWLPARIDPADGPTAIVESFRDPGPGGLANVILPNWWRLDTSLFRNADRSGRLTSGLPMVVTRPFGTGQAMIAAMAFDGRGGSPLTRQTDFVRLVHELMFELAGAKAVEFNRPAGQPISFTPQPPEPPASVTVSAPGEAARLIPVKQWPLVMADTAMPGVYSLTTASGRSTFFALSADPQESDLATATEQERTSLTTVTLIETAADLKSRTGNANGTAPRQEWWRVGLIALLVVLVIESRRAASMA